MLSSSASRLVNDYTCDLPQFNFFSNQIAQISNRIVGASNWIFTYQIESPKWLKSWFESNIAIWICPSLILLVPKVSKHLYWQTAIFLPSSYFCPFPFLLMSTPPCDPSQLEAITIMKTKFKTWNKCYFVKTRKCLLPTALEPCCTTRLNKISCSLMRYIQISMLLAHTLPIRYLYKRVKRGVWN